MSHFTTATRIVAGSVLAGVLLIAGAGVGQAAPTHQAGAQVSTSKHDTSW